MRFKLEFNPHTGAKQYCSPQFAISKTLGQIFPNFLIINKPTKIYHILHNFPKRILRTTKPTVKMVIFPPITVNRWHHIMSYFKLWCFPLVWFNKVFFKYDINFQFIGGDLSKKREFTAFNQPINLVINLLKRVDWMWA